MKIYFYQDVPHEWSAPSKLLTPFNNPIFHHAEIRLSTGEVVCHRSGRLLWSKSPKGFDQIYIVDLPIPDEVILQRLQRFKANKLTPLKWRDYIRFMELGYCDRALVHTGHTCGTMPAYLLGMEDYYKCVPDHIYKRIMS